jgi:hypothetical protein
VGFWAPWIRIRKFFARIRILLFYIWKSNLIIVSNTALNLPQNSRKSFEMIGFCGLNVTAEAVETAEAQFQRDRGSGFSGLIDTAEATSAVSMRPQNPL